MECALPDMATPPISPLSNMKKIIITFLSQLKLNKGDKCVALTPYEWANGYTLYAFQTTDGPIGSGAHAPRSAISTGKLRLSIGFSASK